jgi:hypothetical protein
MHEKIEKFIFIHFCHFLPLAVTIAAITGAIIMPAAAILILL